jgi:hypothetical protein
MDSAKSEFASWATVEVCRWFARHVKAFVRGKMVDASDP